MPNFIEYSNGGFQEVSFEGAGAGDLDILAIAKSQDITNMLYNADKQLDTITYSDGDGVTSHTTTLAYNADKQLQTATRVFDYDSQNWTWATTLAYNSDKQLLSVTKTLTKA